jgi:NAD(P)-dependent dehydrogenase (short-subunit alcohol dehydrogenase family)
MNHFNLKGKTALITGASSGLGAHFAKVLAAEGAHVVLAARRTDKLEQQVAMIQAAGGSASAIALDVNDAANVSAALATLESTGGFDILVNNAGVGTEPKKFIDTTEDDWRFVMETNLNGVWRMAYGLRNNALLDRGGSTWKYCQHRFDLWAPYWRT